MRDACVVRIALNILTFSGDCYIDSIHNLRPFCDPLKHHLSPQQFGPACCSTKNLHILLSVCVFIVNRTINTDYFFVTTLIDLSSSMTRIVFSVRYELNYIM